MVNCGNHQAKTCAACPQVAKHTIKTSTPFHFYVLRETVQPGAMEIVLGVVGLGLAGVRLHCKKMALYCPQIKLLSQV